jgi:cytosylglucuronate decarboxylase
MPPDGPYYLFIRILEACNANCFMCRFARSTDRFRADRGALASVMAQARREGVRVVRFTGGEPLMHPDLVGIIADACELGLLSSIITNGYKLARAIPDLAAAGLDQIVVSIDGATAESHDEFRGTPGLFDRCVSGLEAALQHDVRLRVNTVVGPHNYQEMPALQRMLTRLGVTEWELSSLKLERPLDYAPEQIADILARVVPEVYERGPERGLLKPLGKIWCGDTPAERDLYFRTGVTPRPDHACLVVHRVRYFDMKDGMLYPCSLLPHRPYARTAGHPMSRDAAFTTVSAAMTQTAREFETIGPQVCTGCSTTAAGYGNSLAHAAITEPWIY